MSGETIERARNRWREILPRLGVAPHYLTNKHKPCPLCGGKDRFRWDNKDGSGSYFCGQCGPGSGITLVRKLHQWDFATAAREIDTILGVVPKPTATAARTIGPGTHRAQAIRRALALATSPDVVRAYLRRRGTAATSSVLRGDAQCPYYEKDDDTGQWKVVGHFPAVLAPILGPDGKLQSAQRIYDADVSPRKKTLEPIDTISGGAVRLFEAGETLAITEGIETALAVHELFGLPVWATLSTSGIKSFVPPPSVRELLIYGDNDSNFAGQAAAYTLANSLMNKVNDPRKPITLRSVVVHIPPKPDTDWLDVLNETLPPIDKRLAA